MGRLFEDFQIVCTDYDHTLGKRGDTIQGRTLYKGGHYLRKYGSHNQYIKFENLQIMSPSEDVKIINVLGHYLRKYGNL